VVNLAVPNKLVDVTVTHGAMQGTRLSLSLRKEKAFWLGTYEPEIQQILCCQLRRGATAWDVGAFVGYHTLLMCQLCGPMNVVAVEPDSDSVRRLRRNLSLNGFPEASIVPAAVGSHVGRGFLRKSQLDGRQNIVDEENYEVEIRDRESCEVDVKSLDWILETFGPPDLIKADVEGAEDLMLQGASRLLSQIRPFWILEAHGIEGQNAIQILKQASYRITYLKRGRECDADPSVGTRHIIGEP
jgi:FkbM family methyltransferase